MANRKTNRRRDPATTPHSSWQQVQRYGHQGRGKDCRDADAAKSTAAYYLLPIQRDPKLRRTSSVVEATAVSLRPKVRPYERLCNTISSQRRQMAVSTFEAMAIPSSDGATAITRVEHRRRSRLCFTRPQYETFTLTKQCRTTTHTQRTYYLDASPAMLTQQVLGCRESEPTGGRPAGSQLAAVDFL